MTISEQILNSKIFKTILTGKISMRSNEHAYVPIESMIPSREGFYIIVDKDKNAEAVYLYECNILKDKVIFNKLNDNDIVFSEDIIMWKFIDIIK